MTGDPSATSSSGHTRPPSSQGSITEAERYQAIRNSEGLAMKQLSWVMSHLKSAIGTKRPEREPWEIERSVVERALNSLGVDDRDENPVATNVDDAIQDYKDTLHRIKRVRDIFKTAAQDFEEVVEHLEQTMQPTLFARGVELLPDDLLADILERVERVSPEALASVCGRFRRIMHRLPRRWSMLFTRLSEAHFIRRLEWSHGSDLRIRVRVNENTEDERAPRNLQALLQHSTRWHSFDLRFTCGDRGLPVAQQERESWKVLHLANLRHIRLQYDNLVPLFDDSGTVNAPTGPFAGWVMPNLEHVYFINVFPHHVSNPALVTCSIKLSWLDLQEENRVLGRQELTHLSHFLVNSPSLETLELDFSFLEYDTAALNHPAVQLNRLKTLTLRTTGVEIITMEGLAPIINFFNSLKTPALSDLRLRLFHTLDADLRELIQSLLAPRRDCASFQNLDFSLRTSGGTLDVLDVILDMVPQVQNVTFSNGRFDIIKVPGEWPIAVHPPNSLRTITLDDMTRIEWSTLSDLLNLVIKLKRNRVIVLTECFPHFEKIIVKKCPSISVHALKDQGVHTLFYDRCQYIEWVKRDT